MNLHLYFTDADYGIGIITLLVVLAALGGFMMGFILADNRRKADDAFNPKLRPDSFYENPTHSTNR